jgi:hypothetical protein
MNEKLSPVELWNQAGGDAQRYYDLMVEHGHILRPGDEGYEDGSGHLACGWPGESKLLITERPAKP